MSEQSPHDVVADDFDDVHVAQPVAQLPGDLPEVLGQQLVDAPLVPAEVPVPGQDVISVAVVEHYQEEKGPRVKRGRGPQTQRALLLLLLTVALKYKQWKAKQGKTHCFPKAFKTSDSYLTRILGVWRPEVLDFLG